ncbi:acyl-CoA synthetase [Acrocarpospora pleiomorpha]|uniref:Acyl-CoA synthetase n=1 Tax=Acrocarpospora pleiomorpha TaxID=90975 RepID=A0A5M3XWL0_9ACTN|nr:AMP-binding protein [Acrocarpospora pleiomorpha]GES25555.1 acyl-CoA synthetase [Acrocarpospora pleiomorpha]
MDQLGFEPLTPVAFIRRSMHVHGENIAVVDGDRTFTYEQFGARSLALTGVLAAYGVRPGDRVAALCTNSHVMLELHNAVPMRGAVLVPLNIRLAVDELAYIVEHSGATLLVTTDELVAAAREVCERTGTRLLVAGETYESAVASAAPATVDVDDERALLAINYTSGTTGRPKGVMYHHRGAYLQALAMAFHAGLTSDSRYLWTLPMFHCNGWCFTWAVTAAGGTHVCLRAVDPAVIWRRLRGDGITHLSGAPAVLRLISDADGAAGPRLAATVRVGTGGAPPSPALLRRFEALNMSVQHLYGLTETFGPIVVNDWQSRWDAGSPETVARLKARQGVGNVIATPVRVVDAEGRDVPADARTSGEIAVRGNNVMLGYYRDAEATAAAVPDGWFRTGDLAVRHPDGYIEITDRRKDVIISGGENIASVEVERVLDGHPAVLESAVVGVPDERWGEVPVAYVSVRPGSAVSAEELVAFVRTHLAGFKVPKAFVFGEIPKTSTGKTQKHLLRGQARDKDLH